MSSLPFDVVEVDGVRMTLHEYLCLPVYERIEHVLGGEVSFLREGEPVDRALALRAIAGANGRGPYS